MDNLENHGEIMRKSEIYFREIIKKQENFVGFPKNYGKF